MDKNRLHLPESSGKIKEELEKAQWYLMEEEYQDAKKTLLDLVVNREYSSDSYYVFYWLGIACFGCNDIIAAERYFTIVLEKFPSHIISKLYLAVISVLSGKRKEAIHYLLTAKKELKQNHRGKNSKYISNSLNALKNNDGDENALFEFFNYPYKNKLLPRFRKKHKRRTVIRKVSIITLLTITLLTLSWFTIGDWLLALFTSNNYRTEIVKDINEKLEAEVYKNQGLDKVRVTISDREYKTINNKLERDFINFRDNRVWMHANLILNSNRSQQEKNRALYITENLSGVKYTSDVIWLEYNDIVLDTWKYQNVVVKWKGTIAQFTIREEEEYNTSQFLINFYGSSKELLATIKTYLPKSIILSNGDEVELLATILLANDTGETQNIELRVESFRRLLQ